MVTRKIGTFALHIEPGLRIADIKPNAAARLHNTAPDRPLRKHRGLGRIAHTCIRQLRLLHRVASTEQREVTIARLPLRTPNHIPHQEPVCRIPAGNRKRIRHQLTFTTKALGKLLRINRIRIARNCPKDRRRPRQSSRVQLPRVQKDRHRHRDHTYRFTQYSRSLKRHLNPGHPVDARRTAAIAADRCTANPATIASLNRRQIKLCLLTIGQRRLLIHTRIEVSAQRRHALLLQLIVRRSLPQRIRRSHLRIPLVRQRLLIARIRKWCRRWRCRSGLLRCALYPSPRRRMLHRSAARVRLRILLPVAVTRLLR